MADQMVRLTAFVSPDVAKKIRKLAVSADTPIGDYMACLCDSAIARNTNEAGVFEPDTQAF